MIHSCAGGKLFEQQIISIAKVKLCADNSSFFWCICDQNFYVGEIAFVPFGYLDKLQKCEIVEIKSNINTQTLPFKVDTRKHLFKSDETIN